MHQSFPEFPRCSLEANDRQSCAREATGEPSWATHDVYLTQPYPLCAIIGDGTNAGHRRCRTRATSVRSGHVHDRSEHGTLKTFPIDDYQRSLIGLDGMLRPSILQGEAPPPKHQHPSVTNVVLLLSPGWSLRSSGDYQREPAEGACQCSGHCTWSSPRHQIHLMMNHYTAPAQQFPLRCCLESDDESEHLAHLMRWGLLMGPEGTEGLLKEANQRCTSGVVKSWDLPKGTTEPPAKGPSNGSEKQTHVQEVIGGINPTRCVHSLLVGAYRTLLTTERRYGRRVFHDDCALMASSLLPAREEP